MREILHELTQWWSAGEPVGMVTAVATSGSAPRPAGATMIVGPDGSAVGSVSGGCVEAAVYELALDAAATGIPALRRFGVGDDPFDAGPTCGGTVEVFAERIDPVGYPQLGMVAGALRSGTPVAVATCIADTPPPGAPPVLGRRLVVLEGRTAGSLGEAALDAAVATDARDFLTAGRTGVLRRGRRGERTGDDLTLFVASFTTRPRMIIFGAVDFTAPLTRLGALLGYRVTVCDARPIFATARRFPDADEVVVDWPHRYLTLQADAGLVDERTVVCALTHDPKFDTPLLEVALRLPLRYVGAMGSRPTHADRLVRLREHGLGERELHRLHSPIGLALGGRSPEETAVSIAAEIVAARWGGCGASLGDCDDPIHPSQPV